MALRPVSEVVHCGGGPADMRRYDFNFRMAMVMFVALASLPLLLKAGHEYFFSHSAVLPVPSGDGIWVGIAGDVEHAGTYEINAKDMAGSVILMAGATGRLGDAALGRLHAPPVKAGAQIWVVNNRDGYADIRIGKLSVSKRLLLGVPLDINAMEEADYDLLPGVGHVLAKRIYDYRQKNGGFMLVQDLKKVEGVGKIKYSMLVKLFK